MTQLERASANSAHWSMEHYADLFKNGELPGAEKLVLVVEDASELEGEATAASSGRIVAYLAAQRVVDDWELQNIVVADKFQRQGIATGLMNEFFFFVHTDGRARGGGQIFLEVRESNQAARALYRRLGFEEAGLRKGYYSEPVEAAILCRKSF
jgi:ribosomal-protein-alanine N-acetyltransferase